MYLILDFSRDPVMVFKSLARQCVAVLTSQLPIFSYDQLNTTKIAVNAGSDFTVVYITKKGQINTFDLESIYVCILIQNSSSYKKNDY